MIKRFKKRKFNPDLPVRVHRNLNRKIYTWTIIQKGRVVAHSARIWLRDVVFHVGEAGRQRALKTRQRNVHAWATGTFIEGPFEENMEDVTVGAVHYNPFKHKTFQVRWTGGEVEDLNSAAYTVFDDGGCHVWKVNHAPGTN